MNTIDKVLLEWSLKTDKGYPDINSKEDMDLFESMFGFRLNKNIEEQTKNQDTPEALLKYYLGEEGAEEVMQRPLYQSASTQDFVQNPTKYTNQFNDLFKLHKKNISGYGELIPLVSIKGAKSGGSAEKDIITPDKKIIEVKDLGRHIEFSLASSGNPKNSKFAENLETLMKYVKIWDTNKRYTEYTEYFNREWSRGNLKGKFIQDLQSLSNSLNKITEKKDYIKIGGKKYATERGKQYTFSIDPEGEPIIDLPELDQITATSSKLKNHPWVLDSSNISRDLQELFKKAVDGIDYFLFYKNNNPIIVAKEDFDSKLAPYRFNRGNLSAKYIG